MINCFSLTHVFILINKLCFHRWLYLIDQFVLKKGFVLPHIYKRTLSCSFWFESGGSKSQDLFFNINQTIWLEVWKIYSHPWNFFSSSVEAFRGWFWCGVYWLIFLYVSVLLICVLLNILGNHQLSFNMIFCVANFSWKNHLVPFVNDVSLISVCS